jgi:hypothetical protein
MNVITSLLFLLTPSSWFRRLILPMMYMQEGQQFTPQDQ